MPENFEKNLYPTMMPENIKKNMYLDVANAKSPYYNAQKIQIIYGFLVKIALL